MKVSDIIKKENININLSYKEKDKVIYEMCKMLKQSGCIKDVDAFYKDVLQREEMISTSIGNYIAIPHGKSDEVIVTSVAFVKNESLIRWGDEFVDTVFLLAIENDKDHAKNHLQVLANLSTNLMDDEFIGALKNANCVDEVYTILSK